MSSHVLPASTGVHPCPRTTTHVHPYPLRFPRFFFVCVRLPGSASVHSDSARTTRVAFDPGPPSSLGPTRVHSFPTCVNRDASAFFATAYLSSPVCPTMPPVAAPRLPVPHLSLPVSTVLRTGEGRGPVDRRRHEVVVHVHQRQSFHRHLSVLQRPSVRRYVPLECEVDVRAGAVHGRTSPRVRRPTSGRRTC